MRETYLHRLSRPYRAAATTPSTDPGSAAAGVRDIAVPRDAGDVRQRSGGDVRERDTGDVRQRSGERGGSDVRGLGGEHGGGEARGGLTVQPGLGDRVSLLRPKLGRHRLATPSERGRHAGDACEICGRTLLAGERAHEIVWHEHSVWACPLCVIRAQRAARAPAA